MEDNLSPPKTEVVNELNISSPPVLQSVPGSIGEFSLGESVILEVFQGWPSEDPLGVNGSRRGTA